MLLSTRGLLDRFDERGAYAYAFAPGVQRDDLASFAFEVIGEQANDLVPTFGDETRQLGGTVNRLVDDDGLRPPCFDVGVCEKVDIQIRNFLGFSS